jgi:autotransporter translocation and assembly factor TamB
MWYFIKFIFITCLLSVSTAFYLLIATPAGLQYDLQWLANHTPGKLAIKKIDGTLLSGFTLHDFSYQTPDQQISFKLLDIRWDPLLLLKGKIDIKRLEVEDGRIILSDKNETSEKINLKMLRLWQRIILHHLAIKNLYIEQSASTIELNGDLTDHWDLRWKLREIAIKKWFPDWHGYINSEGTISGSLSEPTLHIGFNAKDVIFYKQAISRLKGEANVSFKNSNSNSSLELTLFDAKLHDHIYKKLSINATGNIIRQNQTLTALIKLQFEKMALLSATISLPNYVGISNPNQKIEAHLNLQPIDINAISSSYTYLKNPRGKISADLDIHGELYHPNFSGQFAIDNLSFTIPSLGIHPEAIYIQGNFTDHKKINLQGRLKSGDGKAIFDGNINLDQENYPLTISLQGDRLSAVQLPEYKILISPDIKIQLNYPVLQLQGKILVPYAEIKPKNFSGTTKLPEEVVFVQQSNITNTSILDTVLAIDLNLGENINIYYNNLQASLAGHIYISKDADSPAIARGEFYALQGRYVAYGQKLGLESGRLIYAGNTLTNPGLDIEAVKKVRRVITNNSDEFGTRIPLYAGTESGRYFIVYYSWSTAVKSIQHPRCSYFRCVKHT